MPLSSITAVGNVFLLNLLLLYGFLASYTLSMKLSKSLSSLFYVCLLHKETGLCLFY